MSPFVKALGKAGRCFPVHGDHNDAAFGSKDPAALAKDRGDLGRVKELEGEGQPCGLLRESGEPLSL